MKPALVTGASGFLGWHVARVLLERGYDVRALVRPGSRVDALDVECVTGDLRDPASLERAVAGCGLLFHVAADYRLWAKDPGELYRSNVDGTRNLLQAARDAGVERVVYTSTVGCIGVPAGGIGDEAVAGDARGHGGRLQALEVSRRAGGAGVRARRPAGGDCEPDRAGGRSRCEAHAHRQDRARFPEWRYAGVHRYRAQRGGCPRYGGRPLAGLRARPLRASATFWARRI